MQNLNPEMLKAFMQLIGGGQMRSTPQPMPQPMPQPQPEMLKAFMQLIGGGQMRSTPQPMPQPQEVFPQNTMPQDQESYIPEFLLRPQERFIPDSMPMEQEAFIPENISQLQERFPEEEVGVGVEASQIPDSVKRQLGMGGKEAPLSEEAKPFTEEQQAQATLLSEAKKYKSAEEFVESQKSPKTGFSINADKLYHETSPDQLESVLFANKTGLNVATSPELALGQGGQGVLVEFEPMRVSGQPIRKPASGLMGDFEFRILRDLQGSDIKSVTIRKGTPVSDKLMRRLRGMTPKQNREQLPDGSLKFNYTTKKAQLTDIWKQAQAE